jgi:segregation and condensation protein B
MQDENFDNELNADSDLPGIIEAVLFAAPEPLTPTEIVSILTDGGESFFLDSELVLSTISALNHKYRQTGMAFSIRKTGDGYSFVTDEKYHRWLRMFQHQNEKRRMSQAGLETLAIVAYRQPVSKPEVDRIRGVDSGYVLKQLLEKELILVAGRSDAPGRPLLYETSRLFLKHFGLHSTNDLPKPREIEEILNDEDMREHKQIILELRRELDTYENEQEEPD